MFALLIAVVLAAPQPSPPEPSATRTPAPNASAAPAPPAEPSTSPGPSPASIPSLAPCTTAKIAPVENIDSKTAQPGSPFRFRVISVDDSAKLAFPKVANDAEGWGIVSVVRRGHTGGEPGLLVLETRFVIDSDGAHVPATFARTVSGLFIGKSHNSPFGVGYIPFVGYAASAYDALHKGGDVTVGLHDALTIVLGDAADMGTCSLPTTPP
jgi:hypothetical protein